MTRAAPHGCSTGDHPRNPLQVAVQGGGTSLAISGADLLAIKCADDAATLEKAARSAALAGSSPHMVCVRLRTWMDGGMQLCGRLAWLFFAPWASQADTW